jgi:voltage-gated potassium channel
MIVIFYILKKFFYKATKSGFLFVLLYFIVSVLIAATGFAYLEKRSFLDSFYWAIVTLTTVGYGDVTPVTFAGRIFSLLIMVLGIGTIAIFAGTIATYLIGLQTVIEERRVKMMKNILLICGYNEKIKNFLKEIDVKSKNIVCIAPLAERPTDLPENIAFISGEPFLDENLKKANVEHVSEAIISLEHDQDAILTVLTIESLNKDVITICNVIRETNLKHLYRLGVDKVFCDETVGGQIFAALYQDEDFYERLKEV